MDLETGLAKKKHTWCNDASMGSQDSATDLGKVRVNFERTTAVSQADIEKAFVTLGQSKLFAIFVPGNQDHFFGRRKGTIVFAMDRVGLL